MSDQENIWPPETPKPDCATTLLNFAKDLIKEAARDPDVNTAQLAQAIKSAQAKENTPGRLPVTEVSNAERLAAQFGDEINYASDRRVWCAWNGTNWAVNDIVGVSRRMQKVALGIYGEAAREPNEELRKALGKWAQRSESQRTQMNSIDAARCHLEVCEFRTLFDADDSALNLSNGTLKPKRDESNA